MPASTFKICTDQPRQQISLSCFSAICTVLNIIFANKSLLRAPVRMISLTDVYHAMAATVPLYVAMILAFISVRFWKLFTPDQCAGINKFVAKFSIPLLSFQVISSTNLYKMNLRLVLADFAQKILTILILGGVVKIRSGGGLRWIITGVSLSTLPNTLILGIPMLRAMYGDEAASLVAQIVFLQSMLWYNLLLFLFELNATRAASVTPSSEATGEAFTIRLYSRQ